MLCDLGQVNFLLWASASAAVDRSSVLHGRGRHGSPEALLGLGTTFLLLSHFHAIFMPNKLHQLYWDIIYGPRNPTQFSLRALSSSHEVPSASLLKHSSALGLCKCLLVLSFGSDLSSTVMNTHNINSPPQPFLGMELRGTQHVHAVTRPPPLSVSRNFHLPNLTLCPHSALTRSPSPALVPPLPSLCIWLPRHLL